MLTCGVHLWDSGFTEKVLVAHSTSKHQALGTSTHQDTWLISEDQAPARRLTGTKLPTPAAEFLLAANSFWLNGTEFSISFLPLSFSRALPPSHSISWDSVQRITFTSSDGGLLKCHSPPRRDRYLQHSVLQVLLTPTAFPNTAHSTGQDKYKLVPPGQAADVSLRKLEITSVPWGAAGAVRLLSCLEEVATVAVASRCKMWCHLQVRRHKSC